METHELTGNAILDGIRTAPTPMSSTATGERELYDLQADPFELSNLVRTADPALLTALSERLAELKNCAVEQLPHARGPARRADHDPGGRDRRARQRLSTAKVLAACVILTYSLRP